MIDMSAHEHKRATIARNLQLTIQQYTTPGLLLLPPSLFTTAAAAAAALGPIYRDVYSASALQVACNAERVIAIAYMSVCLSICHIPVFCPDE